MTNSEKWRAYTANLSSPQSYIEWSWLYTVAAALQRRVWIGSAPQQCFPNMYVILVGRPGIGKGLVLKEVISILRHWELKDRLERDEVKALDQQEQQVAESIRNSDEKRLANGEYQGSTKAVDKAPPLLIPVAADATTFEALVHAMADCYSRINLAVWNENAKKHVIRPHGHASLCFVLPELSSLLRKRTEDTVNYMLGLYDCPEDYQYVTKNSGKDRVRRGCLNVIAGTTPSFMASTFDDRLMDEGWSSRTFYVFANKNRANHFWIPTQTAEQIAYKQEILEYVRRLTTLYGPVKISTETSLFLQNWWDEYEKDSSRRSNKSPKLVPYYSRKNIHVMKLAMAHHFSESLEMEIPQSEFEWAIEFLAKEEKVMHLAITLEGQNPEAKMAKKVLELLTDGEKSFIDLLIALHYIGGKDLLNKALDFLRDTNQVSSRVEEDKELETKKEVWKLI